jgi:hypothetical protein
MSGQIYTTLTLGESSLQNRSMELLSSGIIL